MKLISSSIVTFAAIAALATPAVSATTSATQTYKSTTGRPATPVHAKQTKPADDKTLTDRIEAKLAADASLKRFDVDVSVKDGVATLTGKVRTEAEKLRAARDARVPGVTKVENQITLDKDAG